MFYHCLIKANQEASFSYRTSIVTQLPAAPRTSCPRGIILASYLVESMGLEAITGIVEPRQAVFVPWEICGALDDVAGRNN